MKKTILVTGGSGYQGVKLIERLIKDNYNVINIDRTKKDIPGVTLYPFDIDNHQLKGVIKLTQPDTIMHFAAEHEVARGESEPGLFYQNNIGNTIALLNHAVEAGVKNFVFSSSSSVYGDIQTFPTTEDTSKNPVGAYGRSKSIIEDLLPDYKRAYGLNYAALRYFNAAGADPDAEVGELRELETHIIPLAINASLRGNEFNMFGDDYKTPDGTCVRDYIHVMDLADAHIQAINLVGNGINCNSFNLGSGIPTSNKQLLDSVKKFTGDFKINIKPRRPGDPDSLVADISNTMKYLNWQPQLSSIDKIVSTAVNWHKKANKKEIQ